MEIDYSCENMVKEISQFSDYLSELNPYQIAKLKDYINRFMAYMYTDLNKTLIGSQELFEAGKIKKDQILSLEQMKSTDLLRYERVYGLIEQHETSSTNKGFTSKLTDTEIENLYFQLTDKGFIDNKTELGNFKAIFKNKPLPKDFIKIKWIHLTPKKAKNQTSLREFLKAVMIFTTGNPPKDILNNCFTDAKGKPIELGKPYKGANIDHLSKKFKQMINPI
jgi:hypothetical protein